jgi:pentose-5-phosphate-3-epimerase
MKCLTLCGFNVADITIGPLVVDAIRPLTDAVLDTHLCVPPSAF